MLKLPENIKLMLLGMVYGMMVTVPAVADDIEIYTTAGSTTITTKANVLFVLDTSGSMGTNVTTQPPYDPTVDYSGGNGCYDENRVYGLPYGLRYAPWHCNWYSNWYGRAADLSQVNDSAVVCDAAASLATTGFYTGRVSQYRSNQWRSNISSNDLDSYVECETDNGVHGQNTGNGSVWAADNGPWSGDENDSINWGSVGVSATLYSGRYLNYTINAPLTNLGSRISVMQDVIEELIDSTSGINIGLMRFDRYSNGGMVATPVIDLDIAANKTRLQTALAAMTASGGTPLSESFYEAARYFQGKAVDYGVNSSPFPSVADSRSGGSYISPISDTCQKNYVILLTDGEPTSDSLDTARKNNLQLGACGSNCLDEIATSIGTHDQNDDVDGDQFISTFTIGFAIDNALLRDTGEASFQATGVGARYLAEDTVSLTATLNQIFENIYETDTTFSSPAVSVNAFNRSRHLDDLYFTLFKPALGPHWPGNFKKYKLDFFVDVDDENGNGDRIERLPFIADAAGVDAIDSNTGFFKSGARSFWTDGSNDGADVTIGGAAAEHVNNMPRDVYTFTDSYLASTTGVYKPNAAAADLTAARNSMDKNNNTLTETLLGIVGLPQKITGTPRKETLVDWAAGIDVFGNFGITGSLTDARLDMGDPLHSEPALVQYGGTAAIPDLVAFVATNDGYLHAIDVDDGKELFSFVPQELLPNLNVIMDASTGDKTYGLDGNVVAWVNDIPAAGEDKGNGIIDGSDHVYLYIGMRRGGKNIYSIDVTDRNKPKLRWVIKGGEGDYAELGETWSSINVEKIKDGADEKTVLIFGGGYDADQDDHSVRTVDDEGRAIFIADADSGELLWKAGQSGDTTVTEMEYSIPARIKPLDIKGDGFIDRLYAADMGGQIFRFDIDNDNGSALAGSITGGRIADLADDGVENARRFYYPPDVALIAERGETPYLALSIASGYRAHPNNIEIHDRIYLLKDKNVFNTPATYDTATEAQLYDATVNLAGAEGVNGADRTLQKAALAAITGSEGWFIDLDDETGTDTWLGEKGLSETLMLDNKIFVTTFVPANNSTPTNSCEPQSGTGKLFIMDVSDGTPVQGASIQERPGRHRYGIKRGGIPPSPTVILTEKPTICIGTECDPLPGSEGVRKTFWYEQEK